MAIQYMFKVIAVIMRPDGSFAQITYAAKPFQDALDLQTKLNSDPNCSTVWMKRVKGKRI